MHLIKICAPPHLHRLHLLLSLERRAQAAACPALAIQAQVQSTAGWREKKADREKVGSWGVTGGWKRSWTYATTTGTGEAAGEKTALMFYPKILSFSFFSKSFSEFEMKTKIVRIKKAMCTDTENISFLNLSLKHFMLTVRFHSPSFLLEKRKSFTAPILVHFVCLFVCFYICECAQE